MQDFVHLENDDALKYEGLPNVDTFHHTVSKIIWYIITSEDFPGGPVAKTPSSQHRGAQVWSLVGELDPTCCNEDKRSCAATNTQCNQINKIKLKYIKNMSSLTPIEKSSSTKNPKSLQWWIEISPNSHSDLKVLSFAIGSI